MRRWWPIRKKNETPPIPVERLREWQGLLEAYRQEDRSDATIGRADEQLVWPAEGALYVEAPDIIAGLIAEVERLRGLAI